MALPASDRHPLSDFLHELRRVRSALGRVEERLGDVIDSLEAGSPLVGRRQTRAAKTRGRKYAGPEARAAAARGVGLLTLRAKDPRTVFVSIDRGAEFVLSPSLADLLAVISSAGAGEPDGFVAFQSLEQVVSALHACGRRSSRRAVIVGISRLRGRLLELNHPPLLVETSVRRGVRFRLRTSALSRST